ncbi:M81 family metallopeptidase [Propionibacteriaceae bacterium Y2011]|uniref:M81 family metallopeptidase n=1 Tax=Microlunatus sp. Y2014 TaxID=3418488 RepID=UPI003B497320
MTRLALLGFSHETNTYASQAFTVADFGPGIEAEALRAAHEGTRSVMGGFLTPAAGVELVPLILAGAVPCAPMPEADFEQVIARMVQLLTEQGPWDGVLLQLHGACVLQHHDDGDAAVAKAVRAAVGQDVPIGIVLDMHGNVDHGLTDVVDAVLPFQTNPHVDADERGQECQQLVLEMIGAQQRMHVALEQIPLVVTITKQDTRTEPMAGLLARSRELEADPAVADVSIMEGFPYADVPFLGMSVVVTHRESAEAGLEVARTMAAEVWALREELQGDGLPVPEAVRQAAASDEAPVLLLDVGDNIGGGGPGDSTVMLAEMLAQRVERSVVIVNDPGAVRAVGDTPLGSRVDVTVGARLPESAGEPVPISGTLLARSDGRYSEPKIAHGGIRDFDAGDTIAVQTDQGVTVVVTSRRTQPVSAQQLVTLGIDPTAQQVIVGKGVNGPRAGYGDVCRSFVEADSPGTTRSSVTGFDYAKRRQPMFPYEPETTYAAG